MSGTEATHRIAQTSFKLPSPLVEIDWDRESRDRCHACGNICSGCVGCRYASYQTLRICPPCCAELTAGHHIDPFELFVRLPRPAAVPEFDAKVAGQQQQSKLADALEDFEGEAPVASQSSGGGSSRVAPTRITLHASQELELREACMLLRGKVSQAQEYLSACVSEIGEVAQDDQHTAHRRSGQAHGGDGLVVEDFEPPGVPAGAHRKSFRIANECQLDACIDEMRTLAMEALAEGRVPSIHVEHP